MRTTRGLRARHAGGCRDRRHRSGPRPYLVRRPQAVAGPEKPGACAPEQQVRSALMRALPVSDPGTPDISSPGHFLAWLVRQQWTRVSLGIFWGCAWMVCQALLPAVIGGAIRSEERRVGK